MGNKLKKIYKMTLIQPKESVDKKWKNEMKAYHFKKENPKTRLFKMCDGQYYYFGVILTQKANGKMCYRRTFQKI